MFYCKECGERTPMWKKRCPTCSQESTLEKRPAISDNSESGKPVSIKAKRFPSGFLSFDNTFNGGFLSTFMYFLHAAKGVGKTTFLLQACAHFASLGINVVFFSFDESESGIRKKCLQYELNLDLVTFIYDNTPGVFERTVLRYKPDFVVLDSLQTFLKYAKGSLASALDWLKNEAQTKNFSIIVMGEERKDKSSYLGSTSLGHIADVLLKMAIGLDDEVVISTPEKNRDTDDRTSRCFFKRTPCGLVEISEAETGFRQRHPEGPAFGQVPFITSDGIDCFEDEISAEIISGGDGKLPTLLIAGMNHVKAKSLQAVLNSSFTLLGGGIAIRANLAERLSSDADLACLIATVSLLLEKPVPADTAFIGGVNNRGHLLPVPGMESRVKRAKALGYKRVIGPKATGSQNTIWEEFETLERVKEAFFQ